MQIEKNKLEDNMIIDVRENLNILSPYTPRKMAMGEIDYMEAIPEDYMKAVVFLCVDESINGGSKRIPKATGFFVRVPVEDSVDLSVDYLVTAAHCVNEARQHGVVYIRVNREVGKFIEFPTQIDDWYMHDSADVAAMPCLPNVLPSGIQSKNLDAKSLSINSFLGGGPSYKKTVDRYGAQLEIYPRVGHEVYLLGLFTEHCGEERNLPIARFGNISRMPNLITIENHGVRSSIIAYLIEFHSWGGHSGSPVFYLIPRVIQHQVKIGLTSGDTLDVAQHTNLTWDTGFMGLLNGHYPILEEVQKTGDICGDIRVELNSGIAVVTPAIAVTELLMRDDFVKYRKQIRRTAESKRPVPILDIAKTEGEFSQGDFLQDLRRASQRIEKSKPSAEQSKT